MIRIGIYINDVRCDMYESQSVQIKDSIKKALDVGTLFTQYTRPFKLPASKTNNKIFEHWYSLKLSDGFDARRKQSALITLNGVDYRKGYIKLIDVELKDNQPISYNIQFFGELTTLKDRIGNDILSDLSYLDRFEHSFDIDTVRDGFEGYLKYNSGTEEMEANSSTGEVVYPFISHTRGFQYNTSGGLSDLNTSNPASPTGSDRLTHTDLKPAVRLSEIITAIEQEYDIDFQGDFFTSDTFTGLFMWAHRYKGGIRTDDPLTNDQVYTQNIKEFGNYDSFTAATDDPMSYGVEVHNQLAGTGQPINSDWDKYIDLNNTYSPVDPDNEHDFIIYRINTFSGQAYTKYDVQLTITPDGAFTADYTVKIINRATGVVYGQQLISGGNNYDSGTITLETGTNDIALVDLDYEISSSGLDQFDADWSITATREHPTSNGSRTRSWSYSDTIISAELITEAKVKFNMPKIKVMDFLRGLFKMFNLVAYQEKNLVTGNYHIFVEPYQDFLNNGLIRNITKYVDISEATVERVTPYKQINFDFEDKSTFLAIKTDELSKFDFGSLKWTTDNYGSGDDKLYDGGEYSVMLPFEKMVYERLEDSAGDLTNLMYGWFVNDFEENEPEPEEGAPLIFYLEQREIDGDTINWSDAGTSTGLYNCAQNVKADDSQTLNFNAEYDEFSYLTNENSLFSNYYQDFIGSVYDISARRYKVSCYLPYSFLWHYRLNDKIVINAVPFNIQEITADLMTGKATLDLLKITGRFETYDIKDEYQRYTDYDYVDDGYWGDGYYEQEDGVVSSTTPIVWHKFNNSINDSQGAFESTFISGTETYITSDLETWFSFDGSTYISDNDTQSNASFVGLPFTIYTEVSFDAIGSKEVLCAKIFDTDYEYSFYKTASNEIAIRLYTDSSNYIGIKSTTTLSAATSYKITATVDDSETEGGITLYIDGVAETPVSDSSGTFTGMVDNSTRLLLGAEDSDSPSNHLTGDMKELKMFNAELSAVQVAAL